MGTGHEHDLVARFIAVMAFETSVSGIINRMAIRAGCMFMVGAVSLASTGMIEGCVPVTGVVALGTI